MYQMNETDLWRQRGEDLLLETRRGHSTRSGGRITAALSFLAALVVAGILLAGVSGPASARDFTVTNTNDDGAGSLRRVIDLANLTPGTDTIKFAIPGSGVKTISPISPLPVITEAVTIDAYSQPGAAENTQLVGTNAKLLIELDGSNSRATGLIVRASDVEVQGLVINDFVFGGISVNNGASNAKIEGNFIGTDPSGTQAQGNGGNGVSVLFGGTNNVVGGAPRTAHNLISGNDFDGVQIQASSGNKVLGNLIGTKKNGTAALGNGRAGVAILEAANNTVGSATFGTANTIAFNGEDGVRIERFNPSADVSGNSVGFNSVFSNDGLGIDLVGGTEDAVGATANDPGDGDTGPNGLQNKPSIDSATTSGTGIRVSGRLDSVPNQTFTIQFFSNPSGNEGKKFLGQMSATTNADGNATYAITFGADVPKGHKVTATAALGANTSEFSVPKSVTAR